MGTATHGAERQAQGVGDGVGQATVGAGGHIQQMKAAVEQEGLEVFGRAAAGLAGQRVVVEEAEAGLLIGLEHAPGEQGAHVQLAGPGGFQDRQGQGMAELRFGQPLGLGNEIGFVLEGRQTLQHRHDPIEGAECPLLVGTQGGVGAAIAERVEAAGRASAGRGVADQALACRGADHLGGHGANAPACRCHRTAVGGGSRAAGLAAAAHGAATAAGGVGQLALAQHLAQAGDGAEAAARRAGVSGFSTIAGAVGGWVQRGPAARSRRRQGPLGAGGTAGHRSGLSRGLHRTP